MMFYITFIANMLFQLPFVWRMWKKDDFSTDHLMIYLGVCAFVTVFGVLLGRHEYAYANVTFATIAIYIFGYKRNWFRKNEISYTEVAQTESPI